MEDKIDGIKDRLYEELEHVFDKLLKYHTEILLGYFNAEVRRDDILKPTIRNERLHEISNDNGVRVLPHQKILLSKVSCSHIITFINVIGHLMGRHTIKLTIL
jgi:hypothetical protein